MSKILLLLLASASICLGQELNKNATDDYLVEMKLSLREERIPAIINYLLNNSLEVNSITTNDIIKLSKLDRYDLNATLQVFNYFNVTTKEALTVDALEKFLNALDIKFTNLYKDLISVLNVTEKLELILTDLEIPFRFLVAVSLDKDVYDILKQGVYDEVHVNAALQTAEKTSNEVYTAARNLILPQILQLNSSTFMKILKDNGWNKRVALNMYKALNITTRDVYQVEKFKDIFTNITDDLNQFVTLGVFVGERKLAVHELVYNRSFHMVDGTTVKVEANGLEVVPAKGQKLGDGIVEVATKQAGSGYIEIVESYNTTENCSYVTIWDKKVVDEPVELEGFAVKKSEKVRFILGSALVCSGRLYGLAREEDDLSIIFDSFYTQDTPQAVTPQDLQDDVISGTSSLIPDLLLTFFIYFVLL